MANKSLSIRATAVSCRNVPGRFQQLQLKPSRVSIASENDIDFISFKSPFHGYPGTSTSTSSQSSLVHFGTLVGQYRTTKVNVTATDCVEVLQFRRRGKSDILPAKLLQQRQGVLNYTNNLGSSRAIVPSQAGCLVMTTNFFQYQTHSQELVWQKVRDYALQIGSEFVS